MAKKNLRYVHTTNIHNFNAATVVVPSLINLVNPKSVVDVGCGTGTWLKIFKDFGISNILGIDGSYVDKTQLYIDNTEFEEHDLETGYAVNQKFDIAISLEVAEHLKESSADVFIKTLTDLSDTIIFSAAVKNQGGQNHINEQPPLYWIRKFEDEGYNCYDILRPIFWENNQVNWWYRQNMFIFSTDKDLQNKFNGLPTFLNAHLIHPELLAIKEEFSKSYSKILKGEKSLKFYLKTGINYISRKFLRKK